MKILFLAFSSAFLGIVAADPSSCQRCTEIYNEIHGAEDCMSQCQEKFENAGLEPNEGSCEHMCGKTNERRLKKNKSAKKGGNKSTKKNKWKAEDKEMTALKWCETERFCSLVDTRFNKCPTTDNMREYYLEDGSHVHGVHANVYPMLMSDFPPKDEKMRLLKMETMADSVVDHREDVQLHGYMGTDIDYWSLDPVTGATIQPLYPGDEGFYDEMMEVVMAQFYREDGAKADDFFGWEWPETWKDRTSVKLNPFPGSNCGHGKLLLSDVAEAVNGEYPAYHQQILTARLLKEGVKLDDSLGQPMRSRNDFIGTAVRLAAINTWVFEAVAPVNFMLKWCHGVPRPEEVAIKIAKGEFTEEDGVPQELEARIRDMKLTNAHDFTAYKDTGSPYHPSFPAMHSAGSACSLWMAALCKLTGEQYLEALRVDYAVAMGRTVAGVHYKMDNIAGLNIGQRIIREQLPDHMAEMYDYDRNKLAMKLEKLSFDWNDFDCQKGTIKGMLAQDFLDKANYDFIVST